MKRFISILLLIISIFMLNLPDVFAASGYLTVSASQVYVGDSFTISAVINSSAAWNVHVESTGPVSGCVINQVGDTVDAMNTNKTFTATCTTTGTGTVTVVLSGDVTDASDGNWVGLSGSKTVSVIERPAPTPTPTPTPTPSNPSPSTPSPSTPAPSGPTDTRSTNVSLSSLTIDGKEINFENGVYYLEVGNYLEKVNIAAKTADSKAKVSGTGSKDLKVGDNSFNIVVTAEKGNTCTYVVKVVRKEFNTLSDVNDILKTDKDSEIRVTEKNKLSKDLIDKIIKEKKKITLVRMADDNKTVLYSFILDGSKIKSVKEFNPNVVSDIESNTDMEIALNYADGIYLDFSKCVDVPKGVIVRYYVGDKYDDDDLVNLYAYDKNTIKQLKENIKVKDGYIEFEVTNSIKHFISKAKVMNAEKAEGFNIWMIISVVLGVLCLGLLGLLIFSKTKKDDASIVSEKEKVESNKSLNVDKDIDDGKTKEFKEKIVEEEPEITEAVEDNADEIL